MTIITPEARELLASGSLAHLVTLNRDGSPQLGCVWVGLDGEEIVGGHMPRRQKVRNVERDPRVALSLEGRRIDELGLREYLVVHGRARLPGPGGHLSPAGVRSPGLRAAYHARAPRRCRSLGEH